MVVKKKKGKLAIVNLQPTKHDKKADLKINTYVDEVMTQLCKLLNIKIPDFEKPMVLLKSVHTKPEEKEMNVVIKDELLEMKMQFVDSHIKINEKVLKLKKEKLKLKNSLKRKLDEGSETNEIKEENKNGFKSTLESGSSDANEIKEENKNGFKSTLESISSDTEADRDNCSEDSIRIENVISNYNEYFKGEEQSESSVTSSEENSYSEMDDVLEHDENVRKENENEVINLTTVKSSQSMDDVYVVEDDVSATALNAGKDSPKVKALVSGEELKNSVSFVKARRNSTKVKELVSSEELGSSEENSIIICDDDIVLDKVDQSGDGYTSHDPSDIIVLDS